MRAALYARVSSSRQEQERTIASQVEAIEAYAARQGYELLATGRFCDDGYSGARLDRPALDALRDGARAGAFQTVLVLSPDRLARHYAYQVLILEELRRHGVEVVFVEQPPLDDPAARLLVQIQGAVAEYERVQIAERNRRGRLGCVPSGVEIAWRGGPWAMVGSSSAHVKRRGWDGETTGWPQGMREAAQQGSQAVHPTARRPCRATRSLRRRRLPPCRA